MVVSPEALPLVLDCVRALPGTRFVLDHAGKPPLAGACDGSLSDPAMAAWAGHISALATCPNMAVKLSGLVTEAHWSSWTPEQLAPAARHVLAEFGSDRVMFGSDWPVCLLAGADRAGVKAMVQAIVPALDAAAEEAIWGGCARTWYGLAR